MHPSNKMHPSNRSIRAPCAQQIPSLVACREASSDAQCMCIRTYGACTSVHTYIYIYEYSYIHICNIYIRRGNLHGTLCKTAALAPVSASFAGVVVCRHSQCQTAMHQQVTNYYFVKVLTSSSSSSPHLRSAPAPARFHAIFSSLLLLHVVGSPRQPAASPGVTRSAPCRFAPMAVTVAAPCVAPPRSPMAEMHAPVPMA